MMLGIVVGIVGIIVTVFSIVVTVVSIRHTDKEDKKDYYQKATASLQSRGCFLIVTVNQGEPFAMTAPSCVYIVAE